jgi:hypothetical protein
MDEKYKFDYIDLYGIFDHEKNNHDYYNDNNKGIILEWGSNIGFGQLQIVYNEENKEWEIHSELMNKEFVMAVLKHLVDNANMNFCD